MPTTLTTESGETYELQFTPAEIERVEKHLGHSIRCDYMLTEVFRSLLDVEALALTAYEVLRPVQAPDEFMDEFDDLHLLCMKVAHELVDVMITFSPALADNLIRLRDRSDYVRTDFIDQAMALDEAEQGYRDSYSD